MSNTASLSIWDVFDSLNWNPHAEQEAVLTDGTRNRVIAGGRRSGKSEIGGHELVPECLMTYTQQNILKATGKRREFWIVGPEYTDSEKEFRVLWNSLSKLQIPLDRPGSYNDPIGGSLHLSCWGGTYQVHGKSAKHPETLVGEGLHGVILAEAAKLKEKVWTKFIRPMLADFRGWSLHSSTPEGKNWFYESWQAGQNPERADWSSWRFPSWVNPYVYRSPTSAGDVKLLQELLDENRHSTVEELVQKFDLQIDPEILALLADLTTESFNQEIGADFTEFVGRVFKAFDEEIHVTDMSYNPTWITVACNDYGFTNPSVWLYLQVGPYGQVNVLDEIYKSGLTIPEFAQEIKDRGLNKGVVCFYPDPSEPGDTRQLSEILRIPSRGGTGGEVKDRIKLIRKALKREPQEAIGSRYTPQLHIDRRCTNTIREMLDYKYPDKRDSNVEAPENPLKKNDHCPEALGRFFKGHFGIRSTGRVERKGRLLR